MAAQPVKTKSAGVGWKDLPMEMKTDIMTYGLDDIIESFSNAHCRKLKLMLDSETGHEKQAITEPLGHCVYVDVSSAAAASKPLRDVCRSLILGHRIIENGVEADRAYIEKPGWDADIDVTMALAANEFRLGNTAETLRIVISFARTITGILVSLGAPGGAESEADHTNMPARRRPKQELRRLRCYRLWRVARPRQRAARASESKS